MIKNKKYLLFLTSFVMIIILTACNLSNTPSSILDETGTTSSADSTITDGNNTNPSENDNSYTVTWKNWDGTVLEIDYNVEYGMTPIYNGSTPIRQSNQNNNYVFNGWDKIITSVTKDIEYTATFEAVPVSLCIVNFDSKGGSSISSQSVIKGEKVHKPANPTREGYTFDDWYYQGERWSFVGYTVTEDMTLEARWNINSYSLHLTVNDTNAGTISSNSGVHCYNESITINAYTNPGYLFDGWYDGDNELTKKISYTFNMPAKELSYTARWSVNTKVPYVVEHYKQNIDGGYSTTPSDIDNLTGTTNTLTNGKVNTYEGFSSPSITQEIIKGDGTTVIRLYYTRNSYKVSVNNNYNEGNISGLGTYKYGENVNIQITPYMGYECEGIYINDTFITKDLSYEINNISSNVEIKCIFKIKKEFENFKFASTIDTLTIIEIIDKSFISITIPNSVTSIGDGAFSSCSSLTNIEIPNSVTSIGAYAFYNCSSLRNIEIPNSVTSIENRTFYNCRSLTSIEIPNSVTSIGAYAFYNCSSLRNIEIPNSVTRIGAYAFYNCGSLTNIEIPNSVPIIEYYAFCNCSSLTSITIPNSVIHIGDSAFRNCYRLVEVINKSSISMTYGYVAKYAKHIITDESSSKLSTDSSGYVTYNDGEDIWLINYVGTDTNIIIPNSITKINTYAFYNCSSLTNIEIPNSVTSIGDYAFYNCSSLTSITIPNSVTSIGEYAFSYCSSLTNITIPNSVTSIGEYAFYNCSSLTNITIPNSVKSIGGSAFSYCSSLTNIEIPNSVKSIGGSAFRNCGSLTSITIPNSVTNIGDSAFSGCGSLTNITIPNSVTSIGACAFDNCSSLRNIEIPNSVTSIGGSAFRDCYRLVEVINKSSIKMTLGSSENGYVTYYAKQIITDESSSKLSTDSSGYVTYNDGEDIWLINYVGTDTNIIIPNSITKINTSAFRNCSSLTNIEIPNSVTSIGDYAFYNCSSLTSITIPNSVTSIENYTFANCSSLTNVYYKGTQEEFDSLGDSFNSISYFSMTYYYSEKEPQNGGNYWHYVNGVAVKW